MSVFGVILVCIIPHLDWILSLRIQSRCGKIRTRITPNTGTFYAVILKIESSKVAQRCSLKNAFLEIFQNSVCLRSATLLKRRVWHMCFPVNFAKFLLTSFLTKHLRWLLLNILNNIYSYLFVNFQLFSKINKFNKQNSFFSISLN